MWTSLINFVEKLIYQTKIMKISHSQQILAVNLMDGLTELHGVFTLQFFNAKSKRFWKNDATISNNYYELKISVMKYKNQA